MSENTHFKENSATSSLNPPTSDTSATSIVGMIIEDEESQDQTNENRQESQADGRGSAEMDISSFLGENLCSIFQPILYLGIALISFVGLGVIPDGKKEESILKKFKNINNAALEASIWGPEYYSDFTQRVNNALVFICQPPINFSFRNERRRWYTNHIGEPTTTQELDQYIDGVQSGTIPHNRPYRLKDLQQCGTLSSNGDSTAAGGQGNYDLFEDLLGYSDVRPKPLNILVGA